ncbi:glycerophosphodiester phosphodiesterase family protein [Pontibacter cellulosilyticus]|uniref:Glycerophosphodiester phosphodiesterase n=1 Tax=Pontibacter cellulosilyticus TaxID=1720253 RepID=A0A923N3C7_9BACT|nr:glycerophosphodiester phosphodiesterase family protein [Pontibacter cellulosilyticus]MBC5991488.1 glycerophosphodiester phosphodiesterase [Pontibacter cellulosilyticus]
MEPTSTATVQLPAFDMEGHRGARGLFPENTIPAMLKALELGVTTLEMDTHISKDGKVFLSHDPYFNREHELLPAGKEIPATQAKQHILYQLDYSDIKKYDVGSKFYKKFPEQQLQKAHKPLLAEIFDTVQANIKARQLAQVFYNIETKSKPSGDGIYHPAPEEFVDKLMAVILGKGVERYVIIQSFDVRTLKVVKQKYPEIKTSLLVENRYGLKKNLDLLGFTPDIYSPYYKLVTPGLVKKAHNLNMKVIPWTINTLQEIKDLKAIGVDGVITDYPNLFKEL